MLVGNRIRTACAYAGRAGDRAHFDDSLLPSIFFASRQASREPSKIQALLETPAMTAPPPTPVHLFVVVLVAVYSAARVDGQVPTPESSPVASTSDADGAVAPAAAAIPRNTVFEILAGAQYCEVSGDSCVQTKSTAKGVRQHPLAWFRPSLSCAPSPPHACNRPRPSRCQSRKRRSRSDVRSPVFQVYYDNAACVIAVRVTAGEGPRQGVRAHHFDTETDADVLTIEGTAFSGASLHNLTCRDTTRTGVVRWHSDATQAKRGWRLCGCDTTLDLDEEATAVQVDVSTDDLVVYALVGSAGMVVVIVICVVSSTRQAARKRALAANKFEDDRELASTPASLHFALCCYCPPPRRAAAARPPSFLPSFLPSFHPGVDCRNLFAGRSASHGGSV